MRLTFLLICGVLSGQGLGAAEYVGSQACTGCHAQMAANYAANAMSRASGPLSAVQLPTGEVRSPSGVAYSIRNGPKGLELGYRRTLSDGGVVQGRKALQYFIGSGAHGRGVLFEEGGQLYQSPIAYYGQSRGWDLAPGFENASGIYLHRKVEQSCAACHTSGLLMRGGEPFREPEVSCERCHGPGSEHMAAARAGQVQARQLIVNPAKLTGEARDSVCAQCHLSGEVRVLKPGKTELSYRPGERLSDSMTVFVRTGGPQALKVIGHFEGFESSRCQRESGERFWCGSCHNPHQTVAPAEKTAFYRNKCLACHTNTSCKAPMADRQAAADACTACHMPTRQTIDGEHTSFTDHRIRRSPGAAPTDTDKKLAVTAIWPAHVTPRDYAVAQADFYATHSNWQGLAGLFERLKAISGTAADGPLFEKLGYSADLRGDARAAEEAYTQALQATPDDLVALCNLANHRMQAGDPAAAMELWKRALRLDPGLEAAGLNLANAEKLAGQKDAAKMTVQQLLRLHPDSEQALTLFKSLE